MSEPLILDIDGKVATLTINREHRRNALDHVAVARLHEAFDSCARGDVTVIVLRGAGTKAFSAGDDLKAFEERSAEENLRHLEAGQRAFEMIEEHPCLVIAAIEGYCLGGGLELASACDYRIAGVGATLGLPEVRRLNALPSWGGMTRLPRLIGSVRARELVLFGRLLSAEEAHAWDLVNEVVPAGEAHARAVALATEYAAEVSRSTVALAKQVMIHGLGVGRGTARYLDYLADQAVQASGGFQEAAAAFGAKTKEE